ncbi:glycosyltransferase family 2 protein [Candidatus Pelagisphaera phototrophica]|uniref:glycosyltransferase family 2 protein n=1 Tax=Candidatus Pelagisphaera phototrophica TaxID=2684113 RepID=UPI001A103CA2|nr:glycosyltransferase family 2 protein [Candidatus Pelagisphaera phototrophica]QXD32465.1 glycosyltransferase [Candidatus Pelagisphaera phototrophica]
MPPQVSIIVPVYNCANSITQSLQSLFEQNLTEIEVIAVNDASTDTSLEILNKLSKHESRLKVIHLGTNGGVHYARVAGLKAANSPWIGFLDADDFAKPDMFRQLHQGALESGSDIAICGVDQTTPHRKFLSRKVSFPQTVTVSNHIFETFCDIGFGTGALWNKLYRREIILKHGLVSFRKRRDSGEDTLVNVGCFMDANKVHLIKDSLIDYVLHQNSVTQSIDSTESFTRIIGAYSEAVNIYREHGPRILEQITNLYSKQLDYESYWVDKISDLYRYELELTDAMQSLAQQYPIGPAALLNRGPVTGIKKLSIKRSVKTWISLSLSIPKICVQLLWKKICRKFFQ